MTYTSIFEKIIILFQMITTSWLYIVFSILTVLLIALLGLKKISKKTCFLLISLAITIIFGVTLYTNYEPISKMANTLIDNMFTNIYFPSTYTYLFVLISINIISLASLLNPRGEKIYKTINGICLTITNFVLILILEIIAKDNVDIFTKESLFANPNLITLLEFSINIFIIWLISLVAVYLINNITERIMITRENKKLANDPAVTITPDLSVNNTTLAAEYNDTPKEITSALTNPVQAIMPEPSEYKFIPNFTVTTSEIVEPITNKFIPNTNTNITSEPVNNYSYNYNNSFDLSAFIPKKQEIRPISTLNTPATATDTNQIFEQILKNELPLIKEEPTPVAPSFEEQKNTYTLNDYKVFNKILKDIREHNQSNSITIDKNLEYRLITKYSTETYNMFKTMLKIYSN